MQDFTKNHLTRAVIEKDKSTTHHQQTSPSPNQHLMQSKAASKNWLKQDWFWNLVIWSCVASSIPATWLASALFPLHSLIQFITFISLWLITIIILVLRRPVYLGKDVFLNVHGTKLTEKQLPTGLLFIAFFMITFVITGIINGAIYLGTEQGALSYFIFYHISFSGFFLCFIVDNCPISILFNKDFWKYHNRVTPPIEKPKVNPSSDISYKFLRSNIFNRDR